MATQAYGPGTSASNQAASQASSEPKWTTGQGIGFLVSLTGWILAAAALSWCDGLPPQKVATTKSSLQYSVSWLA